jgi:deoxyribonuclease V
MSQSKQLRHGRRIMAAMARWPIDAGELTRVQEGLARAAPPAWVPGPGRLLVAGCYVCFARGVTEAGAAGDPGVAGAAVTRGRRLLAAATFAGPAGAPYQPALLALREGALLEAAVRALPQRPDVLLVNATGRDHPRRAGLALHLGAALDLPTVGVTSRPLLAEGDPPPDAAGATALLLLDGEPVGSWLRTRQGARPVAVHAAWRTDVATAVEVVLAAIRRPARTPEPLRRARTAARVARAAQDPHHDTRQVSAARVAWPRRLGWK